MNWLLTAVFASIVLGLLIEDFIWRERIYHLPFLAAVLTFAFILPPAMHAMSHETDWVMPVWVHMMIFLVPALYFCAAPSNPRRETRSAVARPNNWLGDASVGGAR